MFSKYDRVRIGFLINKFEFEIDLYLIFNHLLIQRKTIKRKNPEIMRSQDRLNNLIIWEDENPESMILHIFVPVQGWNRSRSCPGRFPKFWSRSRLRTIPDKFSELQQIINGDAFLLFVII